MSWFEIIVCFLLLSNFIILFGIYSMMKYEWVYKLNFIRLIYEDVQNIKDKIR